MNKRIGFPSNTSSIQTSKTASENTNSHLNDAGAKPDGSHLPPPPPPSITTQQIVSTKGSAQDPKSDVEVTDVISMLDKVMATDTLNPRKVTEIKKRVELFRFKWEKDELNDKVKDGMYKLACFLNNAF